MAHRRAYHKAGNGNGRVSIALEVAVDNQCSVENVTRFAQNAGYKVQVSDFEGDFKLTLTK